MRLVYLALLAWTCLVRAPTFLRSAIESDESLYLLIARDWAHGILPYTGIWDHKPVGTYVILRALYWSDAWAVFSLRLAAIIFVSWSACIVYHVARWLYASQSAARLCAFVYPVFSILLGGTASNTEHFFITFTLLGAYGLVLIVDAEPARNSWRFALPGLAFGAAFQVKYVAAVEAVYLVACFARFEKLRDRPIGARQWIALLVGASVPTLLAIVYFVAKGAWHPFFDATVLANFRHVTGHTAHQVGFLAGSLRRYVTSTLWLWALLGIAVLANQRQGSPDAAALKRRRIERFLIGWIAVCWVEASLTGKFYVHYLVPSLVPLALLTGTLVSRLQLGALRTWQQALLITLIAIQPLYATAQKEFQAWALGFLHYHTDPISAEARLIEPHLAKRRSLFVLEGEPILYLLTRARPPTRFVFPPFLMAPHFSDVANIDYHQEFRSILRQAPECVLIDGEPHPRALEFRSLLDDRYERTELAPHSELYCLRDTNTR